MAVQQSLLDLLVIQMKCEYLSDLRFLTQEQHLYLAQKLEQLTPREEDIWDWNDALVYLTRSPPAATALEAQRTLINALRQVEHVKEDRG